MLNLGNITFGLGVNTTGLETGARVLERFGARVDNAMQRSAKGFEYNTTALRKQEAAAVRALQQVQNYTAKINQMNLSPQAKLDGIRQLETAYEALVRRMATPINRTLDPLGMQRATLGFKEQVDAVTRSLNAESTAANNTAKAVASSFERQQLAAMRAQAQVNSLNDSIMRAQSAGLINQRQAASLSGAAQGAGAGFGATMQTPGLNAQQMQAASLNLKASLQGVQRDLSATTRAVVPLQAGMRGLVDVFSMTAGPLNGLTFRLRAGQDMMQQYGLVAGATAAALSGMAIAVIGLGGQVLDITIQYQKAEQTLKGLLNSTAMATAEISYLRDVSNQAGLSFANLAPQFSRFVSAAEGSGQGLAETNEQFRQMSLLSGTLHLTTEEVNRVLLAFDQMLSAGRIMGDDMRQLRNVLPAAYEAAGQAAERMGTSFKDASGKINDLNPSEFISQLLDVYMEMFNIDLNKPIDTLQASLNRITNEWQEFILELSNSIGASEKFQAVFDTISNSLMWMGDNIEVVLSVVGALTGALTGLFAATAGIAIVQGLAAAWSAFNTVLALSTTMFVGARTALLGFSVAQTGAMLTTTQLTAAQTGLNAAMTANPIGIVIKTLAVLGTALWGAKIAYDSLNSSVAANQSMMMDTTSIDSYIAKMKEKGVQVGEVTKALRAQVVEHMRLQAVEAADNLNRLARMRQEQQSLSGPLGGLANPAAYFKYGGADADNTITDVRRNLESEIRLQESLVAEFQKNQAQLAGRVDALNRISLLPEDKGFGESSNVGGGGGRGKGSKGADADRGLRQLNDIINRARDAQMMLDNMWRGPSHSGLVEALNDVQKRLFDMDPDQLARLNQLLTDAGYNVQALGGIGSALTAITLNTQQAEDAVKRFNGVWEDLQSGREQLEGLNRELEYLATGGDPERMFIVQAMNKARDTIRELTTQDLPTLRTTLESMTNQSGDRVFNESAIGQILKGAQDSDAAALDALNRALVSMGYNVSSTGDAAADAQANLSKFYESVDSGSDKVQRASTFFSGFTQAIRDYDQQTRLLQATSQRELINLDALYRAQEAVRYLDDTALAGLKQQLQGLGFVGDDVTASLATFYRTMDDNEVVLSRQQAAMEQLSTTWTDFATNSIGALQSVIMEGESFSDQMLSIILDLGNSILNAAIFDPLKANLTNVITDMMAGKEGVGAADIGSTLMNGFGRIVGLGFGKDKSSTETAHGLNDLTEAAKGGASILNGQFASGLLQSIVGMSTEAGAQSVNTGALISSTIALTAFTAAMWSATATTAFQSAANTAGGIGNLLNFALLADGGQIFGPGGPRADKIPAMLSNQEFVVNADAAQKHLDLLNWINNGGSLAHFAEGGEVTTDMAGFYNGGPTKSGLTSNQNTTKIDARTTISIAGNVDRDTFEEMRAWVEARDAQMREELPYMIDERVVESSDRGRYGR